MAFDILSRLGYDPVMAKRDVTLSLRVPAELADRVRGEAARLGVPAGEVVRRALRASLAAASLPDLPDALVELCSAAYAAGWSEARAGLPCEPGAPCRA